MALEITDDTLQSVLKENKLVVVDFSAPWCQPCRMLGPIIDELSNEVTDITIGKLDVANNPRMSTEYGITSIPCIVLYKDGVEVDRIRGVLPKASLLARINGLRN